MKSAPEITGKIHLYRIWMITTISLLVLATFAQLTQATEPKRILKWKDDKGVTQYGDKIPAQYSNRENSVINQQGITVKRNKPFVYQDRAADQAKIDQAKKDHALLSAFTHENEIDLARDRHLQVDKVTLQSLQMQKINSQKRLITTQEFAQSFKKQKKPIPPDVSADLKSAQGEIAKLDQQITDRTLIMENTRKRFDEDKKRYMALKYQNGDTGETLPSSIAAETATQP